MTRPGSRFDPRELSDPDGDPLAGGDAEIAEATLAARSLEASLSTTPLSISPDLADRIMVAVRRAPPPGVAGILATLRRRPSPAGLIESVRLAWARALSAGSLALRATALAYVALVLVLGVSLTGVAAYSAAGALGLLSLPSRGPDATELVASPRPVESLSPGEVESPEPSETAEPSESPEPSETAGDEHQAGGGSGEGASAAPGGGDDGGGDSGSDASQAPSRTQDPGETPRASSDN